MEHHEVNEYLWYCMGKYEAHRAGVVLAAQGRLACTQGKVRNDRFTDYGDLSSNGTFLYLKNTVAAIKPPVKTRRDSWGPDWDRSGGGSQHRVRGKSDKKLIRLLKSFLADMQGNN